MKEEEKKVLEAWKKGNRALKNNNWEEYKSYWAHADHIELIHPNENEWIRGWEEIGAGYKQLIEQEPAIEATFSDIFVHVSRKADMAWLSCRAEIKIDQVKAKEFSSWQTNIFENSE